MTCYKTYFHLCISHQDQTITFPTETNAAVHQLQITPFSVGIMPIKDGMHTTFPVPVLPSDDHPSLRRPSTWTPPMGGWVLGLGAALLYGFCSTSMAFANKGLLSSYGFSYQATLMAFQMAFTIVALEVLRYVGTVNIPRYSFR